MRCLALSFAPIDCNHEFMLGLTSPEGDRGARLAAEPSYGSIDFAARCGTSQLFEPPQTALIELKRLLARQRRRPQATARGRDLIAACEMIRLRPRRSRFSDCLVCNSVFYLVCSSVRFLLCSTASLYSSLFLISRQPCKLSLIHI